MAEALGAHRVAVGVRGDVLDHVVRTARSYARRHSVEIQQVPHFPRDYVIGAGCIPADAEGTYQFAERGVQRQAAPEYVLAAYLAPDHGIVGGAVMGGVAAIGDIRIYRIAVLQSVQAAARLHGRVKVGSG